jgi:formylglycine-generating enzyme required for sulfatase activity
MAVMKSLLLFSATFWVSVSAFADAGVQRLLVRQQWPWSEKVVLDFALTNVTATTQIDCTVRRGETVLTVPADAFSGDLYEIEKDGTYRIVFDPSYLDERPTRAEVLNFTLTPTTMATDSPYREVLYKIFDFETKAVTDVTRGALLSGKYGSVEKDYSAVGAGYSSPLADVLVWTGVTNYPGAKTTKLVMRKIPAGTFRYGKYNVWTQATQYTIEVDKPFWIGVFELTQKQYKYFRNTSFNGTYYYDPGEVGANLGDDKPVNNIRLYQHIYGGTKGTPRVWDASNGALANLKTMFAAAGTYNFDLPTQAMWFRALRADSTTYYYDGIKGTPSDFAYNDRMAVLGRFAGNGGIVRNEDGSATTNGVASVGSYRPNAFGLYDMIGNVSEATKDIGTFDSADDDAPNPLKNMSDNAFGAFGGAWTTKAELPYAGGAMNPNLNNPHTHIGLRLSFFEGTNPFQPVAE